MCIINLIPGIISYVVSMNEVPILEREVGGLDHGTDDLCKINYAIKGMITLVLLFNSSPLLSSHRKGGGFLRLEIQ